MASIEVFKQKKFKMMTAALQRIRCNALSFVHVYSSPMQLTLLAYPFESPYFPKHLVYVQDGAYVNIDYHSLGIFPAEFEHDPRGDGSIDLNDYGKILDHLLSMNTWIGTESGETLLHGDGTDAYQLEIEADLQD